jgi:hypothetical protein
VIDWQRLAAEEWERNEDTGRELVRDSGVIVPQFTTGAKLRAWWKIRGEPAMRLYETPAAAAARWQAFVNNPDQQVCVFHEHEFGQAIFFFREAIPNLLYVGATYPDTTQGRTTPGSIWAGECRCARYGGPCRPDA